MKHGFRQIRTTLAAVLPLAFCAGNTSAQEAAGMLDAERPIAAGDSAWIEELTWMEVRDRIAAGTTTVIIPTGGIEANGPYLATGKHNLILEGLCPLLAAELGNALCAPIVKFVPEGDIDPPTGAMQFPGSISLRAETYVNLLDDIASSMKQAGFMDIVMIGDSGGNQRGMQAAAERLNERWENDPARAHFIGDYYSPGWEDTERYTEEILGVAETASDGYHDDIWVTAMMAVTDPEQIRYAERVEAGLTSINGVDLKPLRDTIELGRRMLEFRARYTADAIRKALAAN